MTSKLSLYIFMITKTVRGSDLKKKTTTPNTTHYRNGSLLKTTKMTPLPPHSLT